MNIGKIISKYRKEHGLSMEKFAALCGRSKGYISMLEKGVNPVSGKPITPSIDTFTGIASAMNMSVIELSEMIDGETRAASGTSAGSKRYDTAMDFAPIRVAETADSYIAYYDGKAFVPVEPVFVRRNQPVVVTILDENAMTPADRARRAASQLKGMLTGTGMSGEAFAARKHLEKELEK